MIIEKWLTTFGKYLILMGRSFSRPERMRMFLKQYIKEMSQLGVDSIGIVLLISFFIGAVIHPDETEHPESMDASMGFRVIPPRNHAAGVLFQYHVSHPRRKGGFQHRFRAGYHASNPADRCTRHHGCQLCMLSGAAKDSLGLVTIMPFLVIFSSLMGIIGAYGTAFIGHILPPDDLTLGLQHSFNQWFVWMSIIKSLFFAFIISSVSSYFGYTVEGGSVEVGKASTDAVVCSSVLILFSDVFLTQLLS